MQGRVQRLVLRQGSNGWRCCRLLIQRRKCAGKDPMTGGARLLKADGSEEGVCKARSNAEGGEG